MAVNLNTRGRKRTNVHYNRYRSEMFKIVFLGDSNVGKTCLAKLFAERRTLEQSRATIGFDYHNMDIRLEDGANATLQIWDTAGMEKFRNAPALVPQYYHNTDGIVLVFDITEPGSFEGLDNWISEVKQYCTHRLSRMEKVDMILVGNKLDLSDQRKVTRRAAQAYAEKHNMVAYIELSAKDISYLQLLEDSFTTLARQMMKTRQEAETHSSLSRSTTPGIYVVGSQGEIAESDTKLFPRTAAAPGKQVARSQQESGGGRSPHARAPRVAGSSSRRGARFAIPEDLPSTGSLANDWVILAPPSEQVPDYVVLAQEKKRSEPNRCNC